MENQMKYSGIEWIGEIPENWSIVRFKDLYRNKKEIVGDKVAEYERLALTLNGVILRNKEDSEGLQPEKFDGYQILHKDDFIFKMIDLQNISTSRVGLSPFDGLVSPAYIRFCPKNENQYSTFVYYFLMSMYYNCVFNSLGGNGVRSALNAVDMGQLLIPYPNVEEQQVIVNKIEIKCAEIDKLIANQQGQIDKLKEYKQSVITEAVTKGLDPTVPMKDSGVDWIGQIPQSWTMSRIKNICTLNPTQNKCDSSIDIVSYLPMECVKNGYIINREIDVKSVPTGMTWFIENDIIMAKVTPCFENGNIAIAQGLTNKIGCGSSELFVFRPKEVVGKFLLYLLQNRIFTEHAKSTMNGTGGLKRVSPSFVKNFSFALPSSETQQQIADYLDDKCGKIDQLIAIKQQKIDKLQQYKKSLIYEYVTGKKEII